MRPGVSLKGGDGRDGRPPAPAAEGRSGAPIRPFAQSLPMRLLRLREQLMQNFRPHLLAHGMSEQQWRIVRALAEVPSLEILEIGERCCILPASLSHMLPKLEAQGVILRAPHATDQRRVVVSLTPEGRRLFAEMGGESEKIYAAIAEAIGAERLEVLYRLLDEAQERLGQLEAGRPPRR